MGPSWVKCAQGTLVINKKRNRIWNASRSKCLSNTSLWGLDFLFEFGVHLSHIHMRQLIHHTTWTNIIYKFHNRMTVQVHFNRDFGKKSPLLAPGFEPTTFWLGLSCPCITFLTRICISLIDHFGPIDSQCSGGPSRGHKNHYFSHRQHNPEPIHPKEWVCNGFT